MRGLIIAVLALSLVAFLGVTGGDEYEVQDH